MDSFLKKPLDKSFTVIPGRLLGGTYPGDRNPHVMERKKKGKLDWK
jgi:hypothetical protein